MYQCLQRTTLGGVILICWEVPRVRDGI
jgi:hypothetical protein